MTTLFRSTLVALFAAGSAQTVSATRIPPLPDRVTRLPDRMFESWFLTMLGSEFREGRDWSDFFGDVGPTGGCQALDRIRRNIVRRDLPRFRSAYIDAIRDNMNPSVFADIPDTWLEITLSSRIGTFQTKLKHFLRPRTVEMGRAARAWAKSNGYLGRRLGYNAAGVSYWGKQPAMTTLICMFPNDAGYLRGWKE